MKWMSRRQSWWCFRHTLCALTTIGKKNYNNNQFTSRKTTLSLNVQRFLSLQMSVARRFGALCWIDASLVHRRVLAQFLLFRFRCMLIVSAKLITVISWIHKYAHNSWKKRRNFPFVSESRFFHNFFFVFSCEENSRKDKNARRKKKRKKKRQIKIGEKY